VFVFKFLGFHPRLIYATLSGSRLRNNNRDFPRNKLFTVQFPGISSQANARDPFRVGITEHNRGLSLLLTYFYYSIRGISPQANARDPFRVGITNIIEVFRCSQLIFTIQFVGFHPRPMHATPSGSGLWNNNRCFG